MKKSDIVSIIFSLIAIALFITGIILCGNSATRTVGLVFISIGFTVMCLGLTFTRKTREKEKKND